MSKLLLTRKDVEKAVRQYYLEHETELAFRYNFENVDLYFENKELGYLGVIYVVEEFEPQEETS